MRFPFFSSKCFTSDHRHFKRSSNGISFSLYIPGQLVVKQRPNCFSKFPRAQGLHSRATSEKSIVVSSVPISGRYVVSCLAQQASTRTQYENKKLVSLFWSCTQCFTTRNFRIKIFYNLTRVSYLPLTITKKKKRMQFRCKS